MWRNNLIRVHPGAVRTLCTLLWLDLGVRHMATALMHFRDYIEAAIRVEMQPLVGAQIFEMARLAPQAEFLEAVADGLDALDLEGPWQAKCAAGPRLGALRTPSRTRTCWPRHASRPRS